MSWIDRIKKKWSIESTKQFVIVMVVFALTGTTVLVIKRPIVAFFSEDGEQNLWFSILYYILILPTYNVILLGYGFLLGQFDFFWNYEKKMVGRFKRKKKAEPDLQS